MTFNSIQFLCFFPVVCLVYYIIPQKLKTPFLLIASYYFYMCWNPKYAVLILTSTLITYLAGLGIAASPDKSPRAKFLIFVSFFSNLGILAFFKYYGFFAENAVRLLSLFNMHIKVPSFDVLLPVGISFYTFQSLGYTVDVYRDRGKAEKDLVRYALFVSFFPQLVAGPIERSGHLLSQIRETHRFRYDNLRAGLLQMLYGYFQKVMIADTCALFVTSVYDNYMECSGSMLLVATVLFAFQIYCDFGGYSNIACGAAKVMGFSLTENFHAPYLSDSTGEFWRRWHITLNTWFRDYLYIPLGGSRKGISRKYLNLMIVFLVSGLWHGAGWTFVAWGAVNGVFVIMGEILSRPAEKIKTVLEIRQDVFSYRLYRRILTFILVDFAWIFFRADSMKMALAIINRQLTDFQFRDFLNGSIIAHDISGKQWIVLGMAFLVLLLVDLMKEKGIVPVAWVLQQGVFFRYIIYFGLLYGTLIFGTYGSVYDASKFIYFQF